MTGTQIAYYFICKRKLWLFVHKIDMEQTSDVVALGKFISEDTYKRQEHEIKIDDIVLDYYDKKNKVIHEVKKSDKMEETHLWQVKYYINVLEEKGVTGVTAQIDYPKLKQTLKVTLSDKDRQELKIIKQDITEIISLRHPPETINKPFCKNCSYYDLCYS
jgi:CRISPR-associated exonuclease Cas4